VSSYRKETRRETTVILPAALAGTSGPGPATCTHTSTRLEAAKVQHARRINWHELLQNFAVPAGVAKTKVHRRQNFSQVRPPGHLTT
jgi:hypothetical protein